MKVVKNGICFYSHKVHRISLSRFDAFQYSNKIYLRAGKEVVEINNVADVFILDNHIYFKGAGQVKIIFDCSRVFRVFNIDIRSTQFDLEVYKQNAICDIINNGFNLNLCNKLKKYTDIIEKWLNIEVLPNKIIVKQNKFNLPFILRYRLNNKIVQVNVNQTLEEI